MILLLFLIALAPCLFLLWYFYNRDRYEPEPKRKILKIFLLGALMVLPAGIIEIVLLTIVDTITSGLLYTFIIAFIIVAPTEELLKFYAVKRWIYRSVEFDEIMDGIVYTVAASLGFATVENIFYVVSQGIGTGIARAFFAVPGHAFFGALMGYYIGRAKFSKEKEKQLIMKGILFAILMHGLYNFLLLTKTPAALLVIILLIALGLFVRKNLKKAELESKVRLTKQQLNHTDTKQ
ncbi:MAG: PrsW family intramembrane metalloprotease [candidate division WOR-3 bacterium]|nr:MAG: PrsW family intramembrane metalloprotease [candidate division WOR-3 bacterium]